MIPLMYELSKAVRSIGVANRKAATRGGAVEMKELFSGNKAKVKQDERGQQYPTSS